MKKVIVLGSLNMDVTIQCDEIPRNGETINGSDFFMNPGGKGGNQAVACAKLGAPTSMIANVGNDVFGNDIMSALQEYGVHTDAIQTSPYDTTGVAMIIRSHNDNRIILGNGANHTLDIAYVKQALKELSTPGDILLTQLENDFHLVKESITYAKELGMYTILNPAPARVLDSEIYQNLDLVVVNQSECQLLTGVYPNDEDSSKEALRAFDDHHVDSIITLGVHGSISSYQQQYIFVPARQVEAIDTTGAGDSYIGAVCSYLAQAKSMNDALQFATNVAAITVTRKGAQVSIPYRDEVESYFQED